MPKFTPVLRLTVPRELWDEIADYTSREYADSYLCGAVLHNNRLLPRTRMAWTRLMDNFNAMAILKKRKIELVKPPIFDGSLGPID